MKVAAGHRGVGPESAIFASCYRVVTDHCEIARCLTISERKRRNPSAGLCACYSSLKTNENPAQSGIFYSGNRLSPVAAGRSGNLRSERISCLFCPFSPPVAPEVCWMGIPGPLPAACLARLADSGPGASGASGCRLPPPARREPRCRAGAITLIGSAPTMAVATRFSQPFASKRNRLGSPMIKQGGTRTMP